MWSGFRQTQSAAQPFNCLPEVNTMYPLEEVDNVTPGFTAKALVPTCPLAPEPDVKAGNYVIVKRAQTHQIAACAFQLGGVACPAVGLRWLRCSVVFDSTTHRHLVTIPFSRGRQRGPGLG